MSSLDTRAHYESDQQWPLASVPMFVCSAAIAAAAAGWLLSLLFRSGFYWIMLVPMVVALGLGGVLWWLVAVMKCRQHWVAGGIGGLAGILAYLGYFYFSMQHDFPGAPLRSLPTYINLRMTQDVIEDVGRPQVGQKRPVAFFNWLFAGMELAFFTGISANLPWSRARRAYSVELRRWATKEEVVLAPYASPGLIDAWERGELAVALRDAPPSQHPQQACKFIAEWFDPPEGSPLEWPVYASIEDHRSGWFVQTMKKMVLRQVELTTAEVISLRAVLPKMAAKLDVKHPELQVAAPARVIPTAKAAGSGKATATTVAIVTPVDEEFRQRVRNRSYSWQINLRDLMPVVHFLTGLGCIAICVGLLVTDGIGFKLLGVLFGVLAAVAVGWGFYTSQWCLCVYGNRWGEKRLRTELARRPETIVDLADDDLRYVSIIPRESFAKVRLTMASDLLLMKIDNARKQLRLEGDCDRYVIPFASILNCQPLCFFHPIDAQHTQQLWMVRLLLQLEAGEQEILLCLVQTDFSPQSNRRRATNATEFCERINALRPTPAAPVFED